MSTSTSPLASRPTWATVTSGIPAQGCTYWNGPAMESTDYKDLDEVPEQVASTTAAAARNAVHLARVLKQAQYPPYQ